MRWIVCALVLLCSSHADAPNRRSTEPPIWRVLVFLSADNDLEAAARFNLTELTEFLRSAASNDVTVAVQVDRPARGPHAEHLSGTRRFSWAAGTSWNPKRPASEALGARDAAAPDTLRDFLSWSRGLGPARHTLLVLWGHGFGDRGLLKDDGARTTLSVDALAGVLKENPVDVLAMDLCSMQTLEVAEKLAGSARFLVGSETPRPALGWAYAALLGFMASRSKLEPRELAEWLVEHAGDRGGEFTGSALDLNRLEPLRRSLVEVLRRDAEREPSDRQRVRARLSALPWISWGARSVDLGAALDALSHEAPERAADAREAYANALVWVRNSWRFRGATGLAVARRRLLALFD